ncbi:MAG: TolC family protein [Candidatus Rifleibacteriota bacterium]
MNKARFQTFLILTLILSASSLLAADKKDLWTLSDCLTYALENHPQIKIAKTSIDGQKASLKQSKAYWDPRLDLSAGFNRRKVESGFTTDAMVDSTSESLGVKKIISDSGKNRFEQESLKKQLKAARAQYSNGLIEIAASVKKAFYQAQQARALVQVRLDTLDGFKKHLSKVEDYVEVGTRPPYDITRARVDVANANVELISARSRFKVTKSNLARAIGLQDRLEVEEFLIDKLPELDINKNDLKEKAFERPEIKSAMLQAESVDNQIKGIKRSLKPVVSASADYSWSGTTTPLDRQWRASVNLSWPIFDGNLTRARIESAESQLVKARESIKNLRLGVNAELENAVTGLNDALERFKATQVLVQQASESVYLAQGRYDAGMGNPLEVNDARVELTRARGNYIVAFFDSLIARAELDRVTGDLPREFKFQPIEEHKIVSGENNK